ncbi:DUF4263 domain-containing protein [Patescibacteria group bacterium]|nr:DUF4263 domain-containing protein [Patescibacteria group bacterium]
MSSILTTKSIGKGIVDIEEDFILSEEPMSRLVFHAQIHEGGIRGRIIRQRREHNNDIWIPDKTIDIRSLGKNESINIDMNTASIQAFYDAIQKCINILNQEGISYGEKRYAVVDPNSVIITDENKTTYIKKILEAGYDKETWDSLSESNPSLVTKLSYARIITERKDILNKFKRNLDLEKDEHYWQTFFRENTWIFGYGLKYQFLNLITSQPIYSGPNFLGKSEQRGDYLMSSKAEKKFTALVEIKKPNTTIVKDGLYRSETAKLGPELLWSVSQLQTNCNSWFREGSRGDSSRDTLESENIYTFEPKGILVIGHTKQLDSREKLYTFQQFRKNLHNPEILTFDELYERAKFIVEDT